MITFGTTLRLFVGSLFIQSSWSFERLQALGFASAITPALRELYGNGPEGREALKRHLAHFNTNPYLASAILGAAVRMEEDVRAGKMKPAEVAGFKRMTMGAYGAIGDNFFWAGLRPLASVAGVLGVVLWGVWGVALMLLLYNAFHLWLRWRGLVKGLELGRGVAGWISNLVLPRWAGRGRMAASAMLGVAAAAAVVGGGGWPEKGAELYRNPGPGWWAVAGVVAAVASVLLLERVISTRLSTTAPAWLIYAIIPPLLLLGYLIY